MMKRIYFLWIFAVCALFNVTAAPVSMDSARLVGQNFLSQLQKCEIRDIRWVYGESMKIQTDRGCQFFTPYRIFQADNGRCVIVAGDDRLKPILGYFDKFDYTRRQMPDNFLTWLNCYEREARYAISENITADAETQAEWNALLKGEELSSLKGTTRSVSPLLSTNWDQDSPYNMYCPGNCPTGCVATAMAQVMKYHNWPPVGTGHHSYQEDDYGEIGADFGNTTYEWDLMPDYITGNSPEAQQEAVAILMKHCGVAVDMNYGRNGSGAYIYYYDSSVPSAYTALKNHFRYKNTMNYQERNGYTESAWINMLKTELNAGRPIIYSGYNEEGTSGHCFVCDGYDNSDYFHFNWGWSGFYDGYFAISSLNPGGGGSGGGTYEYSYYQCCITHIEPNTDDNDDDDDETVNEVDYEAWGFVDDDRNRITTLSLDADEGLNPYFVIKNNGPSVPAASDTVYFDINIDGDLYSCMYMFGSELATLTSGHAGIISSDEDIITAAEMDDAGLYNSFRCCYNIRFGSNTNTSDPVTSNNSSCLTIIRRSATYTIIVKTSNDNYGSVSGSGTYHAGTQVTLRATPYAGYRFIRWNDYNTNAVRNITVTENATYIAYFGIASDIEEENLESISIFPNPSTGQLFIQGVGIQQIGIYDMMGRKIMEGGNESSGQRQEIDLTHCSSGIYMVKIITQEGILNRKIVIKK